MKDLHVHTTYCDGEDTPEDIILAAIDKGLTELGFSGHSYTPFDNDYCMTPENEALYFKEINFLKDKYKDKIKVLCGIEQDYYSPPISYPYDYVIGSVHYVKCKNKYITLDLTEDIFVSAVSEFFDGNYYALAEKYFETVAEMVKKTKPDIIGHFDIVEKFNEGNKLFCENNARYVNAYKKAADEIIPYNIPFEINTGAVSRGYRSVPYPSPEITEYIKSRGGRFVLSSDSHSKDTLCFDFEKYNYLIK